MNRQQEIEDAAGRIAPWVRQTPVMEVRGFGLDFPIEMKLEHLQHSGSFKARGAFNNLLTQQVPEAGLVAASGGNHGAAVAYGAHQLGHAARVFVPEMAGQAKIDLIRGLGADLEVVPGAYANALEAAEVWEKDTGAMQIHAYDTQATVTGQGTLAREWALQGLDADTILIAVGGGGLIGGAMAWFDDSRRIVAVEPETSCALHAALAAGAPVDVDVSGVAANALGARRIGGICFDLARSSGVQSVLVKDADISTAQTALWRELRQLVEPAGACALAALMSGAYVPEPGEKLAVLICGGNIAPDPFG